MADSTNTPGAMPETTQTERDAPAVEREAESSDGLQKALKAERKAREALEKRLKAHETEKEENEKALLEKRGEFETLKKRLESEVQAAKTALNERIKRDALTIAATKYIAPGAIQDALALVAGEFELKDGELSRDADEFFQDFVKNRPYFAKPAASTPSLKGTSPAGNNASKTITRASFDALPASEKTARIRAGYSVTD